MEFFFQYGKITNISFNNINLKIHKKTNWEENTHDLRPAEGYGIIEGPLNALLAKGVKNMAISKFNYEFGKEFDLIRGSDLQIID